jgi:hypothetical protein
MSTSTPRLTGDRCKCSTCGQLFNSTAAFDKHRTGSYSDARRCRSIEEMQARGMIPNAAGYWVTAAMPAALRTSTTPKENSLA